MLTDVISVPEVVHGVEAGGIVEVVGFECDPEEVSVGDEGLRTIVLRTAAHPSHLAVSQAEVEVGQFDEITLRFIETSVNNSHPERCNAVQRNTLISID